MKCLIKHKSGLHFEDICEPQVCYDKPLKVQVLYAGICKTDLGIANFTILSNDDIILGHEFVGKVVNVMPGYENYLGKIISADPMLFGEGDNIMCGKDCNGCFAEYIIIPVKAAVVLDESLNNELGAFLEPIAAAIAPLKILTPNDKNIAVQGLSRIADLVCIMLSLFGYDVQRVAGNEAEFINRFDAIIETDPNAIINLISMVKPNGKIILKSRSYAHTDIIANDIAMKEVSLVGVRYGDFAEAANLLRMHSEEVRKIFGDVYELRDFATAFAEARKPGSKKIFFKLCAQ